MPGLRRLRAAGCGLAIIIVLLVLPPLAGAATLGVTAPAAPADVIAGEPFTVAVMVGNPTADPVADVTLAAANTTGVDLTGASSPAGACDPAGTRSCPVGALDAGASTMITFTFVAHEGAVAPDTQLTVVFRASIGGADDRALDVQPFLRVPGPTTLAVSGTAVPAVPVAPGDPLAYDVTVTNAGATAAAGVTLEADLPAGASVANGLPSGCREDTPGVVTCPVGGLLSGGEATRRIALDTSRMTRPGTIRVTGRDAAGDVETTGIAMPVVPFGPADLELTITDAPDPVLDDGTLRLVAKVENLSTAATAKEVVTTVHLPAGVTLEPDGDGGCAVAPGTLTCAVPVMLPGEKATFTIFAHVPAGIPAEVDLTTDATTTVGSGDPATTNNHVTRQTHAQPVLALARAMAVEPAQVTGATLLARPDLVPASVIAGTTRLGFPMHGGSYALLTTGSASSIGLPRDGEAASLDARTTYRDAYDATVLAVDLAAPADAGCLHFDLRFFTEEFGPLTEHRDAFVAELVDPAVGEPAWSVSAAGVVSAPGSFATSAPGVPIGAAASGIAAVVQNTSVGTVYDGGTQRLRASTPITPGDHRLLLSIFDVGAGDLDSAVLLDRLVIEPAAGGACEAGLAPTPPGLSMSTTRVTENEGYAAITVRLEREAVQPIDVSLVPHSGTATLVDDFSALTKDITIPAGASEATIQWPIVDDTTDESDETFTVTATALRAAIDNGNATVTIVDDDPTPRLDLVDAKPVPEGAAGTTSMPVVLRLDRRSSRDVSVRVRSNDLTARAADGDYQALSRTVTIPAGRRQVLVQVKVLGDRRVEPDEQLEVVADQPSGLVIGDDTATVTITNDDTDVPVTTKRKPLRLTATATAKRVKRGASAGYRIWVRNPNTQPVRLRSLSACLPAGFTYAKRSGQGVLRGVPKRGRCGKTGVLLTWRRTVTIPAGTTLKTRFGVRVGKRRGFFRISLSGTAQRPWTVRRSGPVARVRVH